MSSNEWARCTVTHSSLLERGGSNYWVIRNAANTRSYSLAAPGSNSSMYEARYTTIAAALDKAQLLWPEAKRTQIGIHAGVSNEDTAHEIVRRIAARAMKLLEKRFEPGDLVLVTTAGEALEGRVTINGVYPHTGNTPEECFVGVEVRRTYPNDAVVRICRFEDVEVL